MATIRTYILVMAGAVACVGGVGAAVAQSDPKARATASMKRAAAVVSPQQLAECRAAVGKPRVFGLGTRYYKATGPFQPNPKATCLHFWKGASFLSANGSSLDVVTYIAPVDASGFLPPFENKRQFYFACTFYVENGKARLDSAEEFPNRLQQNVSTAYCL